MARPKQHHYVTRAYLEGFLLPSKTQLVCYARRGGKPFRSVPAELGKQRNFYALRSSDGSWDDSLEELLGRTVEEPGLRVIRKLVSEKTRLNWQERQALALLIAMQETRTPHSREQTRAVLLGLTQRVLSDIRSSDPSQESIKLMRADGTGNDVALSEIEASDEELKDDHAMPIHQMMAAQAFKLKQIYEQMKLTVYYPLGKARFLTTDNPVIRVYYTKNNAGTGLLRSDVEVRFPLAANAFLSITHDRPRVAALNKATRSERLRILSRLPEVRTIHITDSEVDLLNRGHVRHAKSWVFSPSEMGWIPELLSQDKMTPIVKDLSTRKLLHFQSQHKYDPFSDM